MKYFVYLAFSYKKIYTNYDYYKLIDTFYFGSHYKLILGVHKEYMSMKADTSLALSTA